MRDFKVGDKVTIREGITAFVQNWYKPGATGVIVEVESQEMIRVQFTGGRFLNNSPGQPAHWWVGADELELTRAVDYVPEAGDIVLVKVPGQRARPAEVIKYLGKAIWQIETTNAPIKAYELAEDALTLYKGER